MAKILVDQDLCNRCGICSEVCPMTIIEPAYENNPPRVLDEKAGMCIACGHCEVCCPANALVLNVLPEEVEFVPAGAGRLSTVDVGYYLKKRRSVRHFKNEPVSREKIFRILDIARYAPSGGNGQPVQWIVVEDKENVRKIAELAVEWLKTLQNTKHPLSGHVPAILEAWKIGNDSVCRDAPHLLFAHIPANNPGAATDAIIALSHFDIAAPSFGIGTCWAGYLSMAVSSYKPLKEELDLPKGRKCAYAMMFGYPKYRSFGLPRRNPPEVLWR